MRPTWLYLVIVLLVLASLGVYWAVRAQEGPLYAPPPVLPSDHADKLAPAKYPYQTQPLGAKKPADATLIVPAEVYDVPRPLGPPAQGTAAGSGLVAGEASGIVPTQGVEAPPLLPPLSGSAPQADPGPSALPLPVVETRPPLSLPRIDPAKVLIAEPAAKEAPPKKGPIVELPALPSGIAVEAPAPKAPIIEMPAPPPILIPPPQPAPASQSAPPTIRLPSVTPEPMPGDRPGAFVRIKRDISAAPLAIAPLDLRALENHRLDLDMKFPMPQPVVPVGAGRSVLVRLQTPSVSLEKRGPPSLRRDQPTEYQIVVRNLGPGPAQQVRIEDELPALVKIVSADPMPAIRGDKAIWLLATLNPNQEQVLRLTLQASVDTEITGRISAQVTVQSATAITAPPPRNALYPMAIQVTGPAQVAVGKQAVFQIRVVNQSDQPLTGIVLHGKLPDGLSMKLKDEGGVREERDIESPPLDLTIPPGASKVLDMPANAVKAGHWTVAVKVTAHAGREAAATLNIAVVAETLHLQQPPATRLYMGRDGELRIDVTNSTSKSMRNVTVADRLPDGLDFVDANARGLYQANNRIVYWVIDQLPVGKTQTLVVRVNGGKAGQHQNVVYAKADGLPEMQSAGVVTLEGLADLTMRVSDRDNPLEIGAETVYEIKVQNAGNLPAHNVQLQVQFPAGLAPKNAQGKTRFSSDRRSIVFEPIATLEPQGELTFRVSALAQSAGDQRVRFAVASEEVRVPIQSQISTRVYADKNP